MTTNHTADTNGQKAKMIRAFELDRSLFLLNA